MVNIFEYNIKNLIQQIQNKNHFLKTIRKTKQICFI